MTRNNQFSMRGFILVKDSLLLTIVPSGILRRMKFIKEYMQHSQNVSKTVWIGVICGILVLSGIFGFLYETGFYQINNGVLTRRGTSFGPWIQLYAFGGICIFAMCYKIRRRPWLVLLLSGAVCGLIEYITGWVLFNCAGGIRGWDYNTEIWNWGNIDGFICIRSVAFFAVSGLFLMYVMVPFLLWLGKKIPERAFLAITLILAIALVCDVVYNDLIVHLVPSLPSAHMFWEGSGIYAIVPETGL